MLAVAVDYPEDLAIRIGFLLARAHLIAREEADRALAEVGLTAKGYAALATVVSDAPISQQRLSRRLRMDPATMVDVIDELERSGYMQRRRNPDDRREYALVTTARGRALFSRAKRALGRNDSLISPRAPNTAGNRSCCRAQSQSHRRQARPAHPSR